MIRRFFNGFLCGVIVSGFIALVLLGSLVVIEATAYIGKSYGVVPAGGFLILAFGCLAGISAMFDK